MNKHASLWLQEELPKLVEAGVISAEVAERIGLHYRDLPQISGRQWTFVLFGVLGAGLIGAGIILMLAHNWDSLGRPARTMLAVLPLITAQLLGSFVLLKRRQSAAWCEGVGTFWVLSIGASIALVSQTYHFGGDTSTFLLTWALLGLPIIYLLNCSWPTLIYWVGITAWAGSLSWWEQRNYQSLFYWPLMALAMPHLIMAMRENRRQPRVIWLLWAIGLCGIFGMGFSLPYRLHNLWIPAYTGFFAVIYLVGCQWLDQSNRFWQRPLQTVGGGGLILIALVMTFGDSWLNRWSDWDWSFNDWLRISMILVWQILAIALWILSWHRRQPQAIYLGALPLLGLGGLALAHFKAGGVMVVAMNLYLLGLGLTLIALGSSRHRLGVANLGMLIVCMLVLARFFDADMNFIVRGLAFILLGSAFLAANYWLVRRQRGVS